MRAEVEDAYQSIAAQFREFRDTARVFKRVTKEGTAAHDEQVEQLANGQLGRIVVAFKGIEKSLALLFAECDRIFYTVTPERRKALHAGGRPMKYLLNSVLDRYKAAPLEGRLTLVAFWTVASSLSAYFAEHRIVTAHWKPDITVVDQLLEESKTYEDELRKFKVAVMKYVSSAQFTGVITRERLGEKWNIGNEEHEGEDALAEAEAQLADGNDGGTGDISNKIEYDDEAAKLKATKKKLTRDGERALAELARREAMEFINATPSKKRARATKAENGGGGGDDDNDDDDDEDADGDDAVVPNASADDLPVPKRVSKRGGKNLRRRTRTQIALLKAQARGSRTQVGGDDDDADDEQSDSVDDEGNAKQKNDDDGGVDEPSVSGDSEGVGDFHPDESDDDSDDANDASQDSDDEDDDEDDDDDDDDDDDAGDDNQDDDDDDDEDDNNRDDDEDESEKKPARKPVAKRAKLANGTSKHKAHTTNGTASTTMTTTNGHAHTARKVIDLDEDRDDGEDTASEPATVVVAQTHTASTSTTTTAAPTTFVDPFADLEF